jgi:hypothetical protein
MRSWARVWSVPMTLWGGSRSKPTLLGECLRQLPLSNRDWDGTRFSEKRQKDRPNQAASVILRITNAGSGVGRNSTQRQEIGATKGIRS